MSELVTVTAMVVYPVEVAIKLDPSIMDPNDIREKVFYASDVILKSSTVKPMIISSSNYKLIDYIPRPPKV